MTISFINIDIFPIADLVLSNKLVVYDLENMTIGWTNFNCEFPTLNLYHLGIVSVIYMLNATFIYDSSISVKFVDTDVYPE